VSQYVKEVDARISREMVVRKRERVLKV